MYNDIKNEGNNMKTIKEIAEELNISKQAVRKHIDNLPTTNYRQPVDGRKTILVDDEGVEMIKKEFFAPLNQQPTTNRQPTTDNQLIVRLIVRLIVKTR